MIPEYAALSESLCDEAILATLSSMSMMQMLYDGTEGKEYKDMLQGRICMYSSIKQVNTSITYISSPTIETGLVTCYYNTEYGPLFSCSIFFLLVQ